MPCSCWRISTSQVTCGGDVGVAVAVAADPGAEGERAGAGGQRDADALQLGGEVLQDVADGARRAARRGSRWRCGPRRRARGGRRAARRSARAGRCSRRAGVSCAAAVAPSMTRASPRSVGDAAQLVEDRAAGGLGGVRGEDRADVEVADRLAQVLGVGVLEPVGGAGEEAALGGAAGAQLAAAVHLLGDVGQVEVGGEGADQLGGGLQVGVAEQLGGGLAVARGSGARTCSTRSSSSGPSCRTRVSPSRSPRRRMSARRAALSASASGPAVADGLSAEAGTGAVTAFSLWWWGSATALITFVVAMCADRAVRRTAWEVSPAPLGKQHRWHPVPRPRGGRMPDSAVAGRPAGRGGSARSRQGGAGRRAALPPGPAGVAGRLPGNSPVPPAGPPYAVPHEQVA